MRKLSLSAKIIFTCLVPAIGLAQIGISTRTGLVNHTEGNVYLGAPKIKTLENLKFAGTYIDRRPAPPLIVASTLLVPGYVDAYEVGKIAEFIAGINPSIPYSLLAFHPQFYMNDLPTTSTSHAEKAKQAALKAGLKNVRIGNIHLLSNTYSV